MTGHQLAQLLLSLPDLPVVLHSTQDWTAAVGGASVQDGQVSLGWLPA